MRQSHHSRDIERFTVSIPPGVLKALDTTLTRPGESRSAAVRRLIEEAARAAQDEADIASFVAGYREQPQTDEEFGFSDVLTAENAAGAPRQP
jgi:metal-responsive CopG/Arc/MetJ family transcriptional regulator